MSITKSWMSGGKSGDGLAATSQVCFNAWISDTPAANLLLQGTVQGVIQNGQPVLSRAGFSYGQPYTVLAPQTLSIASPAMPAVPGSGTTFWNVQVDPYTGACTIYTSSSADPALQPCAAPNAAVNQIKLMGQALATGTTNPSLVLVSLPDNW